EKTTDPSVLHALSRDLSTLAAKLEPADAARMTAAAADRELELMDKTSGPIHHSLVLALGALADKLESAAADKVARRILPWMDKTTSPYILVSLVSTSGTLANRMEPAEAAPVATAATSNALEMLDKITGPAELRSLAGALRALAAKLEPATAAAAAARVKGQMDKTTNPVVLEAMAGALSTLADGLAPADAARVTAAA